MKLFHKKLLMLLLLFSSACSPATPADSFTPVTVQFSSTHQALYAGFYAADQNGDYAREGLAVSLNPGGTTVDVVASVLDGTTKFGVTGATTLVAARASGKSVRAIATILRRDTVVFLSLADSGITRLEDFIGKTVYVSARMRPRLTAMLAHAGIDPVEIEMVDTGDINALYSGEVDVAGGIITTSLLSAQQSGYELNVIYPDDYGVHFYSTTIFNTDSLVAADPDLITRFLRATLQGWNYVIENPQAVGALVVKYDPDADTAFQTTSMIATLPYVNTGEDHLGWMNANVWENMVQTMFDQGEITVSFDAHDMYTMEFIEAIYGESNP